MGYNRPSVRVIRALGGIYNVVLMVPGKSGKILASFPSRKQAEEYKRKRRP